MYHIKWDKKNNSIILSNKIKIEKRINPPRPVYYQELDQFGLDRYWEYPKSNDPLLWAIGRQYFYKGIHVASLNGGDIYNAPKLDIIHKGILEPISIDLLIEENAKVLTTLENESKKFINDIYKKNKNKHLFGVAFSGGKDSQVILELVSQVIPPDEFITIFTDTEMELPTTYDTIKQTEQLYKKKYDNFRLFVAKQFSPTLDNWDTFGAPSRLHRWCCSVCKTNPYAKFIKENLNSDKHITVFEGVRREESSRRKKYDRIANGKKLKSISNARPILDWNLSEVFIYLLYKQVKINLAYRYGLTRVGCIVCPFSSQWSEYIINKMYPENTKPFLDKIYQSLPIIGVTEPQKQKLYLENGNWKKRSGGKSLLPLDSNVEITDKANELIIEITSPSSEIFEWIKICKPTIKQDSRGSYIILTEYNQVIYRFLAIVNNNLVRISMKKINNALVFPSILKKIAYKTTFCNRCGACEVECPTNAVKLYPKFAIDSHKCIKCFKCISFVDKGCIVAKSRHGTIGGTIMSQTKINFDRYSTFGLREEWLNNFLHDPNMWREGLGTKQVPALRRWLIEAELMNKHKEPEKLRELVLTLPSKKLWEIVWINLSLNSPICNWYCKLTFQNWDRTSLNEKIFSDFPQYSEGTLKNPINALINTFDNSDALSEKMQLGILAKKGRSVKSIYKKGTNNIDPITIVYLLYRYAEKNGYHDFTLSELYEEGIESTPYRIYGIEKEYLSKILIGLQENTNRIISVEFAANLDNIFLNNDYTSIEILELLLDKGKK